MFPLNDNWYTFTAAYSGTPVRNTTCYFAANFVDASGNPYGADLVKVDYVRISPN
jgi:hypothetical protein